MLCVKMLASRQPSTWKWNVNVLLFSISMGGFPLLHLHPHILQILRTKGHLCSLLVQTLLELQNMCPNCLWWFHFPFSCSVICCMWARECICKTCIHHIQYWLQVVAKYPLLSYWTNSSIRYGFAFEDGLHSEIEVIFFLWAQNKWHELDYSYPLSNISHLSLIIGAWRNTVHWFILQMVQNRISWFPNSIFAPLFFLNHQGYALHSK